jgi:hypothetical protein
MGLIAIALVAGTYLDEKRHPLLRRISYGLGPGSISGVLLFVKEYVQPSPNPSTNPSCAAR